MKNGCWTSFARFP